MKLIGKKYVILIVANVHISGTKGQTKAFNLDKWFYNDFERGQKDEYSVNGEDVGDLLMVKLMNDGGGFLKKSSDWFVDRVVIQKLVSNTPGGVYNFPCFRWVSSELMVFVGKGMLHYFL